MNAWRTRWGLSLVLVFALAGTARAQVSGFFRLMGDTDGDPTLANGIEILGIAWGSAPMNLGPMKISATPPPGVRTVRIVKEMDKSSPLLADALTKGTRFPQATLVVPEGEGSQKYLEIRMTEVMISSYQTSADGSTETIGIVFHNIRWDYPPSQKPPGGQVEVPDDLKANQKAAPEEGRLAAAAAADLLPLDGLTLTTTSIPWGQTATISASDASSKQAGRCFFRYRYDTRNQGGLASGATTNRTHLDAANGPALASDALPGLAAGDEHTASGLLPLKEGTWTLYVHVDDDLLVAEGDEQNNLRRVRVRVDGRCGPESATGKTDSASDLAAEPAPEAAVPGATEWLVASGMGADQFSKVVVRGWDPRKKTSVRTLEMEVASGPVQEALQEAHQMGTPLDLTVKAQEGGAYLQWELKKVYVTSYSISGGGMEGRPGTAHVAISLGDGQTIE